MRNLMINLLWFIRDNRGWICTAMMVMSVLGMILFTYKMVLYIIAGKWIMAGMALIISTMFSFAFHWMEDRK